MCSLLVLICSVAASCFGERIRTPSRTATTACFLRMAVTSALAVQQAGRGANVLALMAEAGGALPDLETAGFAKIVAPRIYAAALAGFCAERLRTDDGRGFLQRKADLRIGGEVGVAAAPACAAAGDDVAARVIGELGRSCSGPFGDFG